MHFAQSASACEKGFYALHSQPQTIKNMQRKFGIQSFHKTQLSAFYACMQTRGKLS